VLSIGAAYLFSQAANQALWEGVLALAAAVLVTSLIVHMWRHAKRIKSEIEGHLAASVSRTGPAAFLGVFMFTLLMITREGMETALLLGSIFFQMSSGSDVVHGRRRAPSGGRWPRQRSHGSGHVSAIASTWRCSSR
jgi:FTR1 family protein